MRNLTLGVLLLLALSGMAHAQDLHFSTLKIFDPIPISTYDPDRRIPVTLYDRKGEMRGGTFYSSTKDTTGRFVVFSVPMSHIRRGQVFVNQDTGELDLRMSWHEGEDGALTLGPNLARDGLPKDSFPMPGEVFVHVSDSWINPTRVEQMDDRFVAAKASGRVFSGYRSGDFSRDPVWTGRSYCGWDAFERHERRAGSRDSLIATYPDQNSDPPFSLGRSFGYPDGDGGYRLIAYCSAKKSLGRNGYCLVRYALLTDYIGFKIGINSADLCRAPALVSAVKAQLEGWVLTRQDEVLN
ncbi:MAG: hypothetical protein AAGE80_09140 [Pseudomonadota bacterium]